MVAIRENRLTTSHTGAGNTEAVQKLKKEERALTILGGKTERKLTVGNYKRLRFEPPVMDALKTTLKHQALK